VLLWASAAAGPAVTRAPTMAAASEAATRGRVTDDRFFEPPL